MPKNVVCTFGVSITRTSNSGRSTPRGSRMRGDAVVAYPLFQKENGGSIPTSPLQLEIYEVPLSRARDLNRVWHSRLPLFKTGAAPRCKINFGAYYDGKFYAAAIWGMPISPALPHHTWLELKRMAICNDAPKNTASRMIKIMTVIIKRRFPFVTHLCSYQDEDVHRGTIYKSSGWVIGAYYKGGKNINYNMGRNIFELDNENKNAKSPKIRWQKEIR